VSCSHRGSDTARCYRNWTASSTMYSLHSLSYNYIPLNTHAYYWLITGKQLSTYKYITLCQEVPSVVEGSSICDSCRKELAKFDPEQLGSNYDTDSPPVSPPTSKSEEFCTDRHSLPSETTDLVTHFHESDDVSRIMPGKKDFVSVRSSKCTHTYAKMISTL
jgi:hypothetical protein